MKHKVLIVEDQKAPLEALKDAVDEVMPKYFPDYTAQDKDIVRCYSEAFDKIANNVYAIVVLDHRMPIQNTGNLEKENFDLFSAQLVNIGYGLLPIIQRKSPDALIIGTSSLSRNERGDFHSPRYHMSKMYGEAERDLEKILHETRGEGENTT